VEYLESSRDGQLYFYDVNALSNFVTDAPRLVGFDPFARFVDFLERRAGLVALAVVTVIAVPGQLNARRPAAHGDNVRQADRIIAASRQPGDAVLYTGRDARYMAAAYPFGLPQLRNIALKRTKDASATLAGTYLHGPHLRHRLMIRAGRLWVVSVGANRQHLRIMAGLDYRLVRVDQTSDLWLSLYVHRIPARR
jgi:hypothetical protein